MSVAENLQMGADATDSSEADRASGLERVFALFPRLKERMASNLTAQVRNIAEVTTAVANGDLSQKITVDAQGEILELKSTINTMASCCPPSASRSSPRPI